MPKFYIKTFILSIFLGIITTLCVIYRIINEYTIWLILTLIYAIVINEKLTIRERWKTKHYLLLATLSLLTLVAIQYLKQVFPA